MKTILALDTSSESCSVALSHQGETYQQLEHAPRNHTKRILPMVQQLLSERSVTMSDLEAIAFGCGPGSFTGIRIAAGIAQGLAYGLGVPIYAISNLECLALQSYLNNGFSKVLVCVDARMGEVYWGLFEVSRLELSGYESLNSGALYRVTPLIDEQVSAPDQLYIPENILDADTNNQTASWSAIGSGLAEMDLFPSSIKSRLVQTDSDAQPESAAVVQLALTAMLTGEKGELENAMPSYVRDSVAWNKLPGRE